jgi:hypothetical protein
MTSANTVLGTPARCRYGKDVLLVARDFGRRVMAEDLLGLFPMLQHPVERQLILTDQLLPPADHATPAQPEQIQALDTVFIHHQEPNLLVGLVGLWSSSLLLSDLAKEHFHIPADEELDELAEDPDDSQES